MARSSIAAGLLGLGLAQLSCNAGAFVCSSDDECSSGSVSGTCEATGWCSFPDEACESGARYGDHAGGSLAGECVPADASTGVADTTSPSTTGMAATTVVLDGSSDGSDPSTTITTEASSDPSVGESSSTGGAPTSCGNGDVESGEACDDANEIDDDECTNDCTIGHGTVLWTIVEDGPAGLADGATAIDIDDADDLYVGAWFTTDEGPTLTARKLTLDGAPVYSQPLAGVLAWDSIYAWGIAVDASGTAFVAADAAQGDADFWIVAEVTPAGNAGWLVTEAGQAFGLAVDDLVWVSGRTATGDAGLVAYAPSGDELHRHEGAPTQPAGAYPWDVAINGDVVVTVGGVMEVGGAAYGVGILSDGSQVGTFALESEWTQALALARGPSDWWVVGRSNTDDGGWVARMSDELVVTEGPTLVTRAGTSSNLHGVAVGPDGQVVAVGWQDDDALVQAYDPDGALAWRRTYDGGNGTDDHARDVVIASDGTIVVAGHLGPLNDQGDFWLFALAP